MALNEQQPISLPGVLSTYPASSPTSLFPRRYPYFTSGDLASSKAVVFVGGLFNGLLDPGYVGTLAAKLGKEGWKLVLMHWSGAYEGFMSGSLDRDIGEMNALVNHLHSNGTTNIVLMGHSTGSQDVAHYLSTLSSPAVVGGIMQAPVSDREYFTMIPSKENEAWSAMLPTAERLVKEGKGEEVLDAEFCKKVGGRMTAYRLFSLLGIGGDDDYFSHDIPLQPDCVHVHPLSQSFGKFLVPVLALFSEKDEFVPTAFSDHGELGRRWAAASKKDLEWRIVPGAGHAVERPEEREILAAEVVGWLKSVIDNA